jgi:hypothetical protein
VTTNTLLELIIPAPAHSSPSNSHPLCSPCISSRINCIARLRLCGESLDSARGSSNGTNMDGEEREWKCRAERTVVRKRLELGRVFGGVGGRMA